MELSCPLMPLPGPGEECVQATGSAPAAAAVNETHDYGVGAVVLAASEIYRMIK